MARAANREAVAQLEQALGALRPLPETRETTELTIDIHIDLRNALNPLGDWARQGTTSARRSRGRSATSTGSRGSRPSWRTSAWALATTTSPSDSGRRP